MNQLGIIQQKDSVSSPIYSGSNHEAHIKEWLTKNKYTPRKIAMISHPFLIKKYSPSLLSCLQTDHANVHIISVPEGEESKRFSIVENVISELLTHRLERQDLLIALGGGVIGDLTGFIASIYLRGIPFINIPTTLLAQVDASIGGKTGINNAQGKNLIGSFYQPIGTWINSQHLQTLSKRELRSGIAEIIKYAIIEENSLFDTLSQNASLLKSGDLITNPSLWENLIEISSSTKINIVNKDVKESGKRALLNFGHTIGHGIETATKYGTFTHGEAIAMGMIAGTYISAQLNHCKKEILQEIEALIQSLGFEAPAYLPTEKIIQGMKNDKKNKEGQFRFILPTQIGHATIYPIDNIQLIKEAIQYVCKNA